MFGFGWLNHEYRLKALESNDEIYSQRIPAINKELERLNELVSEQQHVINNANKRINQLFDVIGVLMEEKKKHEAVVQNIESAYANLDKRIANVGRALGSQEIDIATILTVLDALKTTGLVVKVADFSGVATGDDVLE